MKVLKILIGSISLALALYLVYLSLYLRNPAALVLRGEDPFWANVKFFLLFILAIIFYVVYIALDKKERES